MPVSMTAILTPAPALSKPPTAAQAFWALTSVRARFMWRRQGREGTTRATPVQPINLPPGCRFAPRCQARKIYELEVCTEQEPDLIPVDDGHQVRCWLYHPDYQPDGPISFGYAESSSEQETSTS